MNRDPHQNGKDENKPQLPWGVAACLDSLELHHFSTEVSISVSTSGMAYLTSAAVPKG